MARSLIMPKMSRGEFVKAGAVGLAASFMPSRLWGIEIPMNQPNDDALLETLIANNDRAVERFLTIGEGIPRTMYARSLGEEFAALSASYCQPTSKHFKSEKVLSRLDAIITTLSRWQYPNGMLDSGGNRQSPPDTAFLMDHLCPAAGVLNIDGFAELQPLREKLKTFLIKAGEGLKTGGVHTPNHRWEVSAALAHLYALNEDEGYVQRVDEWLDEGIDINEDGNYSERSRLYANVVDRSLLTIGRILHRPALFEPVRKNLETTYYYMETNGELATVDSRRQDQHLSVSIMLYYLSYRYLAIYYGDETLAAIAKMIEALPEFERRVLSRSLIFFMEDPLLLREAKANKKPETSYSRFLPHSGLARIRRQQRTASIFGGNDKPVTVASGRSTNPTFFTFRKGSAVLEYVRMATTFFNTGYFRADGVQVVGGAYVLHEKKEAYYYQPLPKSKRDKDGDYTLSESTDHRFWSKMDFGSRPTTTLTLRSAIEIEEDREAFKLDFDVDGPRDVEITIELCFRSGGKLEGTVSAPEADDYFLKEGIAKYVSGGDIIEIGPGKHEHANIRMLDGEEYSTHFGTIKGKGMHVYITGLLPFKHSITIR
jgi:hypothetical protein